MKKVIFSLALLLTCTILGYAQKGISYQAVILDPNPIEIPGQDITGQPFVNGAVSLKFKLFSSTFVQEFEEVHATQTDAYGMVNVLIGSVSQSAFSSLVWDSNQKSLHVLVSFDQGGTYTKVSEQQLTYNPMALFAETSGKLSETLSIAGGGTAATTAAAARTNLGLGNVDNTSDANKPISIATQQALDAKTNALTSYVNNQVAAATIADADASTKGKIQLAGDLGGTAAAPSVPGLAVKADAAAVAASLGLKEDVSNKANTPLGTSTSLYPTQNAVKTYVDAQVAGATIADANGSTKGKIQLAGDLAGTASLPTVPGLAAKADAAAVTSALNLKANAADVNTALATKANAADVTTALSIKETTDNKSISILTDGGSDNKYPTVKSVKTYVDTQVSGATIADADGSTKGKIQLAGDLAGTAASPTVPGLVAKADAAAVTTALAQKAPLASPAFTGTVAIGTTNPSSSAALDITSTSQGLLLPRLTYAQKTAISNPVAGLILFCSDCGTSGEMQLYNGTNFVNMVGANAQFALPTLSATSASTAITSSSFTTGGSIESDGGAFVTDRGVVWNTSTNPTISFSTKTTDGTGIGDFSSSVTGLTSGVTYYVRAYATNSVGTKYGPEITVNSAQAVATLATTAAASSITATSASSGGNITYNGGATVTSSGVVWSTSASPTVALSTKTTDAAATGTFTSSITGLSPGTLYYVRSYATNSAGTSYGAQISFTTLTTPTLAATTAASSIASTTATSGGDISSDGGSAVTARGIVWGTTSNPTTAVTTKTTDGTGTGVFTSSLTGLTPATLYYVRSYATNDIGTVYGAETSFTTLAVAPTLSTTAASSITKYAATSGGTITSNGGSVITVSGICWSTSATPTTSDSKTTDGTTSGTFSGSITGLTAGTTYYVRAYATNAIGTSYGAAQSFTTSLPSTTLNMVGDAYGGGIIAYIYQNGDPGYSSINTPVLISATSDQTLGGRVNWSNSTNLSTEVNLSGANYEKLGAGSANTDAIISLYTNTGTYAAKTARDYRGGAYTDWYLPSRDELNKLYINRVVIGSFNTDNSHPVSVYWASTEANSSVANGQNFGTGSYLPDSKAWTFQVRAVRTTTLIPVAINNPILAATTTATSITTTTAVLGGNVTDEGATQVSARGLVYGNTTGSATFNVAVGSGGGTFTSTLTGLAQGTTYYVRSFATNGQGTAYGAETSFTTQTTPTVSVTATPTSLTTTSAVGGGTISSAGGATITTSGLVWGVSTNPEITLTTKTTDGTTSGTFTSSITGLTQGTTYHVRAYATNSIGTSYGPDITFATLTTPTVSATATVTSITGTTATSGGTITADGGASVTVRGLVWGTSTGSSTYSVTTGAGTDTYTSSLTGLTPATTYYVRAFATNSVGTVYGPEVSFSTPSLPILTASAITIGNNSTGVSATLTSELTSDGGATTTRGFIYGIGSYSFTSTATGTGVGTYSATITSLTAGSTYQVKTFATNSAGTVYGTSPTSFTTPNYATLAATYSATNITGTTAESGGSITADGGATVTARGLVWGTSSGSATYSVTISSGTGSFTETLTDLSGGNTYFVRSFATNSVGTSYGAETSFSTVIPTVVSPYTNRIWMDRNLGASRVATSATDTASYGDLFQWGRKADGHEKNRSYSEAYFTASTTTKLASTQEVSNKYVISNYGNYEWTTNWDVTEPWATDATYIGGINNPCPNGFRLPTYNELEAELQGLRGLASPLSINALASSFLKIPGAGYWHQSANGEWSGSLFGLWSSNPSNDGLKGKVLRFYGSNLQWLDQPKGDGYSCRCIKN